MVEVDEEEDEVDSWNSAGVLVGIDEDEVVVVTEELVLVSGAVVDFPSTQMVVVMSMVSVTISHVVVHTTARFS